MSTAEVVPSAPAAAPSSAPASAPSSAPVSSAPVSAPIETAPSSAPVADKYAGLSGEQYANAVLADKLKAIQEPAETQPDADTTVADPATEAPAEVADPATPEVVDETKPVEDKPAEVTPEEDFELEPETIVTPDVLGKLTTDNPEFAKLLEGDPKLKGQLYKTAREAAELQPYRELFPDLESAKSASQSAASFNDVRDVFMGSTTKDGTIATLGKMAEFCYERDEQGNVVTDAQGNPQIGEDFYGFVDNVASMDLDNRDQEVSERLAANRYPNQEARDRDEMIKAAVDVLKNEQALNPTEELPAALKQREADIARREQELNQRQQGEKVEERRTFEQGLQAEAQKRISDGISRIIANVEKQGAAISPYLKNILPKAIGAKLVQKIQANPALQGQMRELQRLPLGDSTRTRRLAAIDRAVQQYLPEVAREELREAGVQTANSAAQKRAKVDAQAENTKKTEPRGSTGPATQSNARLDASSAFDHAKAEWSKANPNMVFDKVAKESILPRVLQLMSS